MSQLAQKMISDMSQEEKLRYYKQQAVQNILKSKESRKAREILAQVSTHHEAFKCAVKSAEDKVELEFSLANKKVSLWTTKQIADQSLVSNQLQQLSILDKIL